MPYVWGNKYRTWVLLEEERLKVEFKKSVEAAKKAGFTKRVPFTGPNSGKPKGLPNVDFVAIKRYDGIIQYYKKP